MERATAVGWIWILAAALAAGCAAEPAAAGLERHEYRRVVMGVQARIVAWAPDEESARAACAAAFDRMLALDRALSDYDADSEATRLCARAGEGTVHVSDELFEALELSRRVAAASDGAFDVTAGPLTRLWRAARGEGTLPGAAELARARALVGWDRVALDPAARTAALLRPGMALDFGAIGKGLAADAALAELRAAGVSRALVEVGGDLACGDPPPGRAAWTVLAGCGASAEPLELARRGVATSGDTEQFLELDGVRHSHVLDPRTGRALTGGTCATAVARTAAAADALASVAGVLGPAAARATATRLLEEGDPSFADVRILDHLGPRDPHRSAAPSR